MYGRLGGGGKGVRATGEGSGGKEKFGKDEREKKVFWKDGNEKDREGRKDRIERLG